MKVEQKLDWKCRRLLGQAIHQYNLIEDGDRICVGVSGGKDSYTLLHLLESLRHRAPVRFELVAVNIDSGYPGFQKSVLEEYLTSQGYAVQMISTNAWDVIESVRDPRQSYCAFCARLRRGALTTAALAAGCNKIALGHHADDFIETLLLNLFYSGTLAAMPVRYREARGSEVIRPLIFIEEADIVAYSTRQNFPIICCACPVCGSIDQKRKRMKRLVSQLAEEIPDLRASLLGALGNLKPERFPVSQD